MWNKVQLFIWKPFKPILQCHCHWRRLRRRKRRRHEWRRFRLFRVNVHDMIWQHRIQFLVWFVNKDENLRHKLALNIFNVFNFVGCFLSFKNHLPTWTARKSFFLNNRLGLIYIIYQLCNYAISSMLLTYLSFISKQSVVEVSHQIKSGEKCWVHIRPAAADVFSREDFQIEKQVWQRFLGFQPLLSWLGIMECRTEKLSISSATFQSN